MGTEERQLTTGAEMEVMRPQAEGCQQPPSREELEATGTAAPLRPRRQRSPADTWVWLGKDLGLRPLAREEAAPSVTSPSSRPFVPAATGDLVPARVSPCTLTPSAPATRGRLSDRRTSRLRALHLPGSPRPPQGRSSLLSPSPHTRHLP